jgi:cysteine sulfinate desulfinase/cysteine desulfurase-like protein
MTVEEMKRHIPSIVFYGAFDKYLEQTTDNRQQITDSRLQITDYRQQTTDNKLQIADNRLQTIDKKIRFENRLPNNINCRIPGISSEEMILRLDAKGFSVSHKSACASMETDGSYVITALGYSEKEALENIRISMGRSTTENDMRRLVQAMKNISLKYTK